MTKYFYFILLILFGFSFNSSGQVFSHALGASFYKNSSTNGFGLMYSPRLNFLNFNDNVTLSLGTHFGVGVSSGTSSEHSSSGALVIDAPILLELNVLHACNTENSSTFGFYLGGGLGYNKMTYVDDDGEVSNSIAGIVLNGGLRTNVINERSIDLRISYLVDATGLASGVFAIGLSYTFGMAGFY